MKVIFEFTSEFTPESELPEKITMEWDYSVLPRENELLDSGVFHISICEQIEHLSWRVFYLNWERDETGIFPKIVLIGE